MQREAYDELVQSHDATTCAFNTESINGDANRMAVCGESAGGSMSLVMSMLTKERQQPGLLKAQVALCPATDLYSFNTPSYEDFADDEFEVRCA